MEAPEKVHVFVYHNEDLEVYEMPLKTLNGTLITVEYTRSDLCTMPGELVDRAQHLLWMMQNAPNPAAQFPHNLEVITDILAWHEGKG